MTEAAFSYSAETEDRRLKSIRLLAEFLEKLLFIYLNFANQFLIEPCEHLDGQLNHFFNPQGPRP